MDAPLKHFRFSRVPIDTAAARAQVSDGACGGYAAFEGWVRDQNEGQPVRHLEYEAFEPLAIKEGERILAEAIARFGVEHAACVHRVGDLAIGELAVWVGVSARHRHEAFQACRYIIDEVKHRVPIWKKEHYENGDSGWVNCERCASGAAAQPTHAHEHHEHGAAASAPHPDYSRQMALPQVGATGQARLAAASVLVVGAGGLGVPVLSYLAGAGVGRIGIVDGDRLEPSNLHRQTLYALADAGRSKAELAAARLAALNPAVRIEPYAVRLDASNAARLIEPYGLVVDCSDNFSTKFLINDVCVRLGKPAILSSVYQFEGQLQVIRPERGGACLRCIWPEATRDGLVGNCAQSGVLGPVPGVFGSLEALEALKLLLDLPGQLGDELLVIDLTSLASSRVRAQRAPGCRGGRCTRVGAGMPSADEELDLPLESLAQAERQGFTIIDVREARELSEDPLPASARHIPLQELIYGRRELDRAQKYLLVCASGKRSRAAAAELRARGYASAYSLPGGVAALKGRLPA